jgi:hypothetical protein
MFDLDPYYVIEKSKFWSKNGFALMASILIMLYTAGKSVKSYVDWYQNYENRLAGLKVSNFKFEQKTSNQKVSDQL